MVAIAECPHHWLCAPQGGPTSQAVCKLCGTWRVFQNSMELAYESWNPGLYRRGRLDGDTITKVNEGYWQWK